MYIHKTLFIHRKFTPRNCVWKSTQRRWRRRASIALAWEHMHVHGRTHTTEKMQLSAISKRNINTQLLCDNIIFNTPCTALCSRGPARSTNYSIHLRGTHLVELHSSVKNTLTVCRWGEDQQKGEKKNDWERYTSHLVSLRGENSTVLRLWSLIYQSLTL